jgi:hypothetical protein
MGMVPLLSTTPRTALMAFAKSGCEIEHFIVFLLLGFVEIRFKEILVQPQHQAAAPGT